MPKLILNYLIVVITTVVIITLEKAISRLHACRRTYSAWLYQSQDDCQHESLTFFRWSSHMLCVKIECYIG